MEIYRTKKVKQINYRLLFSEVMVMCKVRIATNYNEKILSMHELMTCNILVSSYTVNWCYVYCESLICC